MRAPKENEDWKERTRRTIEAGEREKGGRGGIDTE